MRFIVSPLIGSRNATPLMLMLLPPLLLHYQVLLHTGYLNSHPNVLLVTVVALTHVRRRGRQHQAQP